MAEKILVVDDDIDTLRLVGLMLQRQGYQIVAASNGQQALQMAHAEKPDLILLDVMMPDMDGYEVTRRLRADTQTNTIPIIMFTAKTQVDDKVTGFEAGADDYLAKPFDQCIRFQSGHEIPAQYWRTLRGELLHPSIEQRTWFAQMPLLARPLSSRHQPVEPLQLT